MNTQAQTALAAAIGAISVAVADIGKAIAGHPATQADDSGQILKAAEELQGMAGQLETIATQIAPPAPEGDNAGATGGDPAGDNSGATAGTDATVTEGAAAAAVTEPVAPEAGSEEGPGTLEPTPETVEETDAEQPQG